MDELYRHLLNGNPRRASGFGAVRTYIALFFISYEPVTDG
jgi:hypothetical protein